MKNPLLLSFLSVLAMILVMKWQGADLITPVSPKGILDLEFARSDKTLAELKLFWNDRDLTLNIYLDFLFIAAYVWFLTTACRHMGKSGAKWSGIFNGLALAAGSLDVLENCLMLLIWNGGLESSWLQAVYFIALIKFVLAGTVVLYLLVTLPLLFRRNVKDKPN